MKHRWAGQLIHSVIDEATKVPRIKGHRNLLTSESSEMRNVRALLLTLTVSSLNGILSNDEHTINKHHKKENAKEKKKKNVG